MISYIQKRFFAKIVLLFFVASLCIVFSSYYLSIYWTNLEKDDILDEQFFSTFCKNTVNGVNILSSWASQFSSSNEFEIPVRQSTKKNSNKDNIEPFSQFLQLTQQTKVL